MDSREKDPGPTAKPIARKANGQFRKGSSGNPSGRPVKPIREPSEEQLANDVLSEMDRAVPAGNKRVPAVILVIRKQIERAIAGDARAAKQMLEIYKLALAQRATNIPTKTVIHKLDAESRKKILEEAMRLLG